VQFEIPKPELDQPYRYFRGVPLTPKIRMKGISEAGFFLIGVDDGQITVADKIPRFFRSDRPDVILNGPFLSFCDGVLDEIRRVLFGMRTQNHISVDFQ
jgi:hypothetical protein